MVTRVSTRLRPLAPARVGAARAPDARHDPLLPAGASDLLRLQRQAGNRAVAGRRVVQRAGGPATLRRGSSGPQVEALQQALAGWGQSVSVDGAFGPRTEAAVRAVQHEARLGVDGVVGPRTWAALQRGPAPPGAGAGPGVGAAATAQQLLSAIKAALAARKPAAAVVEGASVETGAPVALAARHDWLDDAAEAAGGLVDEAGEAVGGVVDEAREATEGAVDWMVEQAEEAVGAAEEFVQGVGETVSEGVGAAADWAAEQAGAAGEWVSEQAEAAGAAVSEAAGEVWQAAQELGEEVVQELGQTWQDLKQAIDDLTSGKLGADLINRLKRILDDVTGGGDDEGAGDDELDGGVVGPLPGAAVEECGRGDTTLVRDDKVDLSLASHHTVTAGYSGEITGAGKEVATFALGRSEWKRHDDGSIGVFGVIQMDNAWGVNSHGLIDVASAESPAVTKDTWVRVCEDLTPNSGGWPARTTYWSKDLSSRHEMFHANDDDLAARAATRTVAADLQGKFFRPAKDMGPQATQLLTTAVEKVSLAVQDHYKDGGEARAYAVGKFDYQSLVDAIKARAAREGWVGSPKEPAPLPASGTPLVPD